MSGQDDPEAWAAEKAAAAERIVSLSFVSRNPSNSEEKRFEAPESRGESRLQRSNLSFVLTGSLFQD
jgi:hypothetical protein